MAQIEKGEGDRNRLERGGLRLAPWLVGCLLLLLSGCALTFAYRHADWLIVWQLDHYFDLRPDQRREVTQRLKPLLSWHRHEAILQYEAVLTDFQQRVERGLTSDDIDWVYATYDWLRADLFELVAGDGGVFLASVEARQVRTLERALQKDNRQAVRLAAAPMGERLRKRAEVTLDGLEEWLGSLSKEQRAQIRAWSLGLPDTQPVWIAYQQHRQQELLAFLRQPRTAESVAEQLRAMFTYPEQSAPPDYRDALYSMREAVKRMALAVDQGLTSKQRRHAVGRLQRLIDQLRGLQVE